MGGRQHHPSDGKAPRERHTDRQDTNRAPRRGTSARARRPATTTTQPSRRGNSRRPKPARPRTRPQTTRNARGTGQQGPPREHRAANTPHGPHGRGAGGGNAQQGKGKTGGGRKGGGVGGRESLPPGRQRYRCKAPACKRTFHDLPGPLLDGSQRAVRPWLLAPFLWGLSCASRRMAREVGAFAPG